jgi:diguanylate cyclase (GGDEF)-like protein
MESSLRGNEKAYRIYTLIHLAIGVSLFFAVFKNVPIEKLSYFSNGYFEKNEGLYFAFYAITLIGSLISLQIKILMISEYFVLFDIAFAMAAFFLLGPIEGTSIAIIAITVDIIQRIIKNKKNFRKLVFTFIDNMGNRLLRFSILILGVYIFNFDFYSVHGIKAYFVIFVLFIIYVLANNLFYVPSEYFKGNSLKIFWIDTFKIDLPHTFLMFILGYYFALISVKMGIIMSILTMVLIVGSISLIAVLTKTKRELARKVEELTILTTVSEAASSGLDLLPMVEGFSRKLCESLSAEGIGVVFCQPYSTTLNAVQVEGEKSRTMQLPEEEKRYQYDSLPLSEPSKKLGEALYEFLQPLETAPFFIPKSCYGIPLIYRSEPIGGMVVYSSDKEADFSRRQGLLETCAHALIVGMENCFLHLQAIEDPLTGLYNRSYFLYRLKEELSYSTRHSSAFAIIMIDLDEFKEVNDHLGHQVGDEVLRKIGELFRVTLRKEDVPARYGGDEFIILLLNCDEKNAVEKANKIKQIISIKALPKEKSQGIQLGCSISLISSKVIRGDNDITAILKKLDNALYKAKTEGKNQVVVAV